MDWRERVGIDAVLSYCEEGRSSIGILVWEDPATYVACAVAPGPAIAPWIDFQLMEMEGARAGRWRQCGSLQWQLWQLGATAGAGRWRQSGTLAQPQPQPSAQTTRSGLVTEE